MPRRSPPSRWTDPGRLAAVLLLAWATHASAAPVAWKRVRIREGGAADIVLATGRLDGVRGLEDSPDIALQVGEFSQSIPGTSLVRSGSDLRFRAPPGAAGIASFDLSLKSGQFSVKVRGVDVGAVDEPVAITLDVGGLRTSALHPFAGEGATRTWRKGAPIRSILEFSVFEIGSGDGNVTISPAAGRPFLPPSSFPEGVTVLDADDASGADGVLRIVVELSNPAALDGLAPSRLVGTSAGLSLPSGSGLVAGTDGRSSAVVLVQPLANEARTAEPGDETKIVVAGAGGAPGGDLVVAPDSLTAALDGLSLTPLSLGAQVPLSLPAGFVAVAAAEVRANEPRSFVAGKGARLRLSRPRWAGKEALASADLRLLRLESEGWTEMSGRGAYDEATDSIVPDDADPALLAGTGPAVWAVRTQRPAVTGRVRDDDGARKPGLVVLGRNGATISGSDGSFAVAASALDDASLEVVQVVSAGRTGARAVDGAADAADIRSPGETERPLQFGLVSGRVLEPGGTAPAAGAQVTVRLATAVRGLRLDDAGTATNPADDTFVVPDLTDLGVAVFRWSLLLPGDDAEFLTAQTGPAVSPTRLILDAQDAGLSPGEGPYTVRVAYDVPVLGEVSLFAGFRVTVDGISPGVDDVQLPAAVEGVAAETVTTAADGTWQVFLRAPDGVPMTATAVSADGLREASESFFFASSVATDVVFDAPPPTPPAGLVRGWNNIPSMSVGRSGAIAAVVPGPSGDRIAVVGGNGATLAVEFYDPATGTWTTGATSLLDHGAGPSPFGMAAASGRLWCAGGSGRRFESYDPAANAWREEPQMATSRLSPAVASSGDLVYVFGGFDGGALHDSVEVFDTSTGLWGSGPRMPLASFQDEGGGAVRLGEVIHVIGRSSFSAPLHQLSFDDDAGTWASLPAPPTGRRAFAVANVNGEVWIVAGDPEPPEVEVYDAVTGAWRPETVVPDQRLRPAVLHHEGVVYAFGGFSYGSGGVRLPSCLAYRPNWDRRAPAFTPRAGSAASALGGRVYLAGGSTGGAPVAAMESYDVSSDFWRSAPPMPSPRSKLALVTVAGRLFAIGGEDSGGNPVATVEMFEPAIGRWTARAPMSRPRSGAVACESRGRILVAGGGDATVESYDLSTDTWSPRRSMSVPRTGAAAALFAGKVVVAGGRDGATTLASTEIWDPVLDVWTPGPPLATARHSHGMAQSGARLYVVGGTGAGGATLSGSESIGTSLAAWASGPGLPVGRTGAAVAAADGVLVVVGGVDESGATVRTALSHDPD